MTTHEQEIRWLRFSAQSADVSTQKLEYSMKGPLYAASAVFEMNSPVTQIVAKAKASFAMRHWEMATHSALQVDNQNRSFSSYREETRGPSDKTVEWSDESTEWKSLGSMSPAAPVLSAPELLFAFAQSYDPAVATYGAFFVAGHKLQALRLDRVSDTVYSGRIMGAGTDVSPAGFSGLNWKEAREFELEWSPEERLVRAIRVKFPALGRLQAKLVKR